MFRKNVLNTRSMSHIATALVVVLCVLAQGTARAQDLGALTERVIRLEANVQEIRRHLLGGRPLPAQAPQQVVRPSSTENAANIDAAGLAVKLADLEREIRQLTGRLEQTEHENRQLKTRIDGLVSDTDHRLNQFEGGSAVRQTGTGSQTVVVHDPAISPQIGTGRDAKTQVLGTIPASGSAPIPTQAPLSGASDSNPQPLTPPKMAAVKTGSVRAAQASAPVAPSSAKGQYEAAFALLRARRFAEAEVGFQKLLSDHPKDSLAGNAQYWIGETHYARKDYEAAAASFLTGYKKYRSSSKGPDNLLKLGITLTILKQKDDACAVFDELKSRYAKATASIIRRMKRERKKAGC